MFSITASGTIAGKDPEIKYFESGRSKVRFTLQNRRGKDKNGNNQNDFLTVEAWGKQAEFIAENFKKGDVIEVAGKLENQAYEKDGQKRDFWVINAQVVGFVPKKFEENGAASATEEIPF